MSNKKSEFGWIDDYDFILEEKEKELRKERRNKVILGSSLALLLLLGTTAVVAPIVSVSINNKNNLNKLPNKLVFNNQDIEKLIDGYKSEIQTKRLSFNEFKNDFLNITKKYIVASNINISPLVNKATITKDSNNNVFNISIELEQDDREYSISEQLTKAKLDTVNKILFLSFNEVDKVLEFFSPINIDFNKLNSLKELIQNYIDKNKLVFDYSDFNSSNAKNQIANLLGIDSSLINKISYNYDQKNLIIEPKNPYTFKTNVTTNLIVNGNIEISIINFYELFTIIDDDNPMDLCGKTTIYNALNEIIHSNKKWYSPKEFEEYIHRNFNFLKQVICDNLDFYSSPRELKINDILDINLNKNYDLIITLNDHYCKYKLDYFGLGSKLILDGNNLILENLDFFYGEHSPILWFDYTEYYVSKRKKTTLVKGISNEGKNHGNIILPNFFTSGISITFNANCFSDNNNLISIDMSMVTNFYGVSNKISRFTGGSKFYISSRMFSNCSNLKTVILPKTTKEIGFEVFKNCKNLKWVKISSKIDSISDSVFSGVNNSITIYVPTQELKTYYDNLNLNGVSQIIVGEPPTNI